MDSPNIVYVFADQWPAFALGYASDPNGKTPHLDVFAKEAVNCRFAVANTPVCIPSRATLLTGKLPGGGRAMDSHRFHGIEDA